MTEPEKLEADQTADDGPVAVRATIHLRGLRAGDEALVDPTDPYIAALLDRGFLFPV